MSNGNNNQSQPATVETTKTDAPKKFPYVVLVDNHTHDSVRRKLGEIIEFDSDRIPSKYPKIFAKVNSAAANKAIADAKAAAEKAAADEKAEAERVEAAQAEEKKAAEAAVSAAAK